MDCRKRSVSALLRPVCRGRPIAFLSWYQRGPLVVGGVLIGAGLYQVSPLKEVCLNHCRSPLAFLAHYWKPGKLGALQMGARHAVVCVGCCWAMMGVMFAVGTMNLVWMALLTVFMFAEKVMPYGRVTAFSIASILVVMGGWIAVSPDTAPLLKDPLIYGSSICRSIF
ncbi:DUF2182 domain-containing protein [Martelella soudanensis]|uniref:DUF2182 domain-containing protein n=1 Tax=Martelella sp. NC18 TaxID=2740297 RepID=UPI0035301100